MSTTDTQSTQLTEAYHVIYDVKDAHLDNDFVRFATYGALGQLATVMDALGIPVPDRRDGDGRPGDPLAVRRELPRTNVLKHGIS